MPATADRIRGALRLGGASSITGKKECHFITFVAHFHSLSLIFCSLLSGMRQGWCHVKEFDDRPESGPIRTGIQSVIRKLGNAYTLFESVRISEPYLRLVTFQLVPSASSEGDDLIRHSA
jgi:hypothetical protein